ncbi:MAG TPA: cation transporter [Flavobacteriaceae bacterium]|nr:cation transporter [Flavobacteriaceae bacterium]
MKSLFVTVIIALFTTVGQAQTDKFEVHVNGLGCPYCASGLEDAFKKFDGISDIKIDIQKGLLTFSMPAEANLSTEKVATTVEKASYTAVKTKVERANGKVETSEGKSAGTKTTATMETKTFEVAGECGMCKKRIETAAKGISGVSKASWKVESDMLTVTFNSKETSAKAVQKAVANVGHDTEAFKATDEAYKNLHACCKYERME